MKIVHDERLTSPIFLASGDSLELTYTDPGGKTHILSRTVLDATQTIDRVKVAQFGAGEVPGFKGGYLAIIGEASR